MLKITFFVLNSGDLTGFSIKGHAGYSFQGSDIVCAAVSSASYMLANTLTDVMNVNADIDINEKKGYMQLELCEKDVTVAREIMKGFKLHMLLLEDIYPKNIKVDYSEVE